jgi:4-hydroxy-4-methyl-2-oxoglutarate aldolase
MSIEKKLTGRLPPEAIRRMSLERLPAEWLKSFAGLNDLTSTVSDSLDNLGLIGALPASVLSPTLPACRMVGQAVTVRNVERLDSPTRAAAGCVGKMGEHEAYNLAEPGDVVVIEGLTGVSNMGGLSAALAHRSGCAGAVIDGSYRDPDSSRDLGFPLWAKGVTPITGKWRLETVEINGRVRIAGVAVDAGDLVVADEAGVVFVPFQHVEAVLAQALKIDAGDARQKQDIASGVELSTLAQTRYK